jgi:hypothetical protein
MYTPKQNAPKMPDFTKLQAVRIDHRTRIYIALDADPEEARNRYHERLKERKF